MKNPAEEDWRLSPTELLEQAFHLLRTLRLWELAPCLIGPAPFGLALLYFWSDMSRRAATPAQLVGWSLVLALLYCWMKVWQGVFARLVWRRLLPEGGLAPLGWNSALRRAGAVCLLGSLSLPVLFVALNLLVPIGWVYAAAQNATVLAFTLDGGRPTFRHLLAESARQSHVDILQNHLALLLLAAFSSLVWANVVFLGVLLPILFTRLTGVETEFSLNPMAAFLNTLFLTMTVLVSWLLVSPLFRVTYVLRNFYSLSRGTGADLLSRLQSARAAALGLLLFAAGATGLWAEADSPEARPRAAAEELQTAIERTLSGREYQWRMPPDPAASAEDVNPVVAFLRQAREKVAGLLAAADALLRRWWEQLTRSGPVGEREANAPGLEARTLQWLLYGLGGLLLLTLGALALHLRRRPRAAAAPPAPARVNLAAEEVLATELPEDQWLAMARELLASQERRLAIRALFLATLAALGEQRLLEVARSKTNRQYRDELAVRARSRPELLSAFAETAIIFEQVWYGRHEPAEARTERLLQNYQTVKG